jgi:hypothetical protein
MGMLARLFGRRPANPPTFRELVRDRELLASLVPGGSPERPITVSSAAVIEIRAEAMPCHQCEGHTRIREHAAEGPGRRRIDLACTRCSTRRSLWFRIGSLDAN